MDTDETKAMVLEQGSPEALKVARAIASSTSGDILDILRENGPMSLSAISEKMQLSLNSTKYHLEHLVDAGLVEIVKTRWSEKGKEMKIYAVVEKDIILKPKKKSSTAKLVGKYGTAAGIVAVCCVGISILSRVVPEQEITTSGVVETSNTKFMATSGITDDMLDGIGDTDFLSILSQADGICIVLFIGAMAAIAIMFLLSLRKLHQ